MRKMILPLAALLVFVALWAGVVRGSASNAAVSPEQSVTEQSAAEQSGLPEEEQDAIVIGGKALPLQASEITVEDPDAGELNEKLVHFPSLKKVSLTGRLPDAGQISALEAAFPQVEFVWQVSFDGNFWDKEEKNIVLVQVPGDHFAALSSALALLPELEQVDARESDFSDSQLRELADRFPQVFFLWQTTVAGVPVQTDAEELDLSGILMESVAEAEESLFYLRKLKTLVMCDCGIDDETMAAFRERARQQCKVVWQVHIGRVSVRSDTTTLMPYQFGYTGDRQNELTEDMCGPIQYLEDMVCMDLGHMEIRDISFVANMPELEYLLVADTGISDISAVAGLKKLKYLEIFYNHIRDISPLTQCPALEDVNMCVNEITDITPLLGMTQLNNLWLSGYLLTEAQRTELQESLPDTYIEFWAEGSVSKGWRRLPNYYAQRDLLGMWYLN